MATSIDATRRKLMVAIVMATLAARQGGQIDRKRHPSCGYCGALASGIFEPHPL